MSLRGVQFRPGEAYEMTKPKTGTERIVVEMMASAVAKHLTMLSAYFMVAATSSPPTPLTKTTSHTTSKDDECGPHE